MIHIDDSHLTFKMNYEDYKEKVKELNKVINEKTGAGNDFLGWADYPLTYDKEELVRIKAAAKKIRENYDTLVVCGIGGSYLGARAAIEAVNGLHKDDKVEIIYFGQTFDPEYISQTLKYLEKKNFAINVISKSGTTTETAIGFRLLWNLLRKKVGTAKAQEAVFATTDKEKGALLGLCKKYGYERFILPADIGGRYSVFTAVGLLPIAVAGIDVDQILEGAKKAREDFNNEDLLNNDCYKYAVIRHHMYKNVKKQVEMLVTYQPKLVQLGEWWKQLYGESEGKEGKGIFPAAVDFTTDLHSMGQYIQDGERLMFETFISVCRPHNHVSIPSDKENLDKCFKAVRKAVTGLQEKPFSDRRLKAAKKQLLGQLAISSESGESQCLSMGKSLLAYGRIPSDEENRAAIEAVTAEDLRHMAGRIFSEDNLSRLVFL